MIDKLKNILSSKKFLYVLIGLFAAQGIYFSAVINYKVPSDEEFHFVLTKYHAERPITAGPIIQDQSSSFMLGDIQRTPSYLYHYFLSFYLRVVMTITGNQEIQVFVLRLVNVALGVMALLMLVSIFKRINKSQLTINLTIAWLALTGMFVWVFAGISYDNLSMFLFFYLLYELIGLKNVLEIKHILISIVTALALVLTKETYVPIVLLSFVLLIGWHLKRSGIKIITKQIRVSSRREWKTGANRWVLVILAVSVVLFAGLFVERYVQNYARYGKVTPNCDQVHAVEECMQSSIYRRNTGQRKEFLAAKQNGNAQLDSTWVFTRNWVGLIYERTYFYRGHQTIIANKVSRIVGGVSAALILLLLIYSLTRARKFSSVSIALGIVTISYILLVFFYNLNTYHYYGYPFAIQGRYLLPVLPFVYLGIITALVATYRQASRQVRTLLVVTTTFLIVANLAVHTPFFIYKSGAGTLDQPVISVSRQPLA